ncbi:extracellular solute-binding protein [Cohnella thailandensis]|uniref:Extracellular solute-binding protein n=1 Tax=Cohnella thailandensis TaxID=557557 RepID=A0A841SZB5_9BACL|nr:extracellular solute-binding protein [Cohnella thailandensis]MBB6635976.1 extracellular solute-binding protein [Cohnella thailandensis]MBP1976354.1 putative aldouronate transport system substrate-binding protein [Cohnella thailandensis]
MKRSSALLASLTAVAVLATACSGNNNNGNGNEASPAPGSGSSASGSPSASAAQTEKLKLNWYVIASADAQLPKGDADFVKKAIDEKFNVDLVVDYMPLGTDFQNKFNSLVASNDIPDVFFSEGIPSNQYIKDGVAREMTGLVTPENMPNYFKYWITEEELPKYQVQGKFARAPIPYEKNYYRSYYIRQDWLDKLGLSVPKSYDEMVEVMKAFTTGDPDGNGKNDTYGFSAYGNGTNMSLEFPTYVKNGLFGDFMVEGDQFIDTRTDPRMQQVLTDTRALLDLGVVDPDWLLNKNGQQLEKAEQGKVGIVLGFGKNLAFDNNPEGLQAKTKEITKVETANWAAFDPFAETGTYLTPVPGNPFLFSSKSSDEEIDRSMQILDWLAGEEGFLMTHYGREGTEFTRDGSTIALNQEAFKTNVTDQGNFLSVYQWFTPISGPEAFGIEVFDPNVTERDKQILETINSYKLVDSVGTSMVVKEGMDLAALRKRMNELQVKVLYDDKNADNWPKYREELMTKYQGKEIFDYYAQQVSEARGTTITFNSGS